MQLIYSLRNILETCIRINSTQHLAHESCKILLCQRARRSKKSPGQSFANLAEEGGSKGSRPGRPVCQGGDGGIRSVIICKKFLRNHLLSLVIACNQLWVWAVVQVRLGQGEDCGVRSVIICNHLQSGVSPWVQVGLGQGEICNQQHEKQQQEKGKSLENWMFRKIGPWPILPEYFDAHGCWRRFSSKK